MELLGGHGIEPSAKLKRLATCVVQQGKVRKSVLLALKPPPRNPQQHEVRVPCKVLRSTRSLSFTTIKVYMVNEVVEILYREYPSRFRQMFLGETGLCEFWSKVKIDDPRLVGHPMVSKPRWMHRAIPIVIHGDGFVFTKNNNSMGAVSFGGVMGSGWSEIACWLMALFPKSCRTYGSVLGVENDTWQVIWKWLRHGLDALFSGVHPESDPDGMDWPANSDAARLAGTSICDGHFFATLWLLANDREWVSNELRWPHWNNLAPCGYCDSRRGDTDFSLNAPWKACLRHGVGAGYNHPVWGAPGVSRYMFLGDWAHGVDGGTFLYLHFECLNFIKTHLCRGLADASAAAYMWSLIKAGYDACGVPQDRRLQSLLLKHFKRKPGKSFVAMKMSKSKALVKALHHVLGEYCLDSEIGLHLYQCYSYSIDMLVIIDKPGLFLESDRDAEALLYSVDHWLLHYKALHCMTGGVQFNITNKFHTFWHIAYLARYQHPRAGWTYVWEDFMGKLQRMCSALTDGTPHHRVALKAMENYELCVAESLRRSSD